MRDGVARRPVAVAVYGQYVMLIRGRQISRRSSDRSDPHLSRTCRYLLGSGVCHVSAFRSHRHPAPRARGGARQAMRKIYKWPPT